MRSGRCVLHTLPDGTKIAHLGSIEVSITGTARIAKSYYKDEQLTGKVARAITNR